MKQLSYFLFYTYVGLVLIAGFWGAFIGPWYDHMWLFDLDPETLPEFTSTNMISQYRFLRAIEFGFGLFSILFTREIFTERKFNTLFIVIMSSGVAARLVSVVAEGSPSFLFYFFLVYELIGVIVIFFHTRKTIYRNGK